MLIDRLDWVDGWPYVRAGAGPSDGTQPGPVTDGAAFTTFEDGIRRRSATAAPGRPRRRPAVGPVRRRAAQPVDDHRAGGRPGHGARRGRRPRLPPASRWARASAARPRDRRSGSTPSAPLRVQVARRARGRRPYGRAPLPAGYKPTSGTRSPLEVRGGVAARRAHPRPPRRPAGRRSTGAAAPAPSRGRGRRLAREKGADVDNLSVLTAVHAGHRAASRSSPRHPGPQRERRVRDGASEGRLDLRRRPGNPDADRERRRAGLAGGEHRPQRAAATTPASCCATRRASTATGRSRPS